MQEESCAAYKVEYNTHKAALQDENLSQNAVAKAELKATIIMVESSFGWYSHLYHNHHLLCLHHILLSYLQEMIHVHATEILINCYKTHKEMYKSSTN